MKGKSFAQTPEISARGPFLELFYIGEEMEVPKKKIQKWCEALRSGEFSQSQRALQTSGGYCCLGVAVKLFSPNHPTDYSGSLCGVSPAECWKDPDWLANITTDFLMKTEESLVSLNDFGAENINNFEPFTFDEIADQLEAVYLLEVLN